MIFRQRVLRSVMRATRRVGVVTGTYDHTEELCAPAGSYVTHETKHFLYAYIGAHCDAARFLPHTSAGVPSD